MAYLRADLTAWLQSRRRTSTSDYGSNARSRASEPEVMRLAGCSPEVRKFVDDLAARGEARVFQMHGEPVVLWTEIEPYTPGLSEPSNWDDLDVH